MRSYKKKPNGVIILYRRLSSRDSGDGYLYARETIFKSMTVFLRNLQETYSAVGNIGFSIH